YMAKAEMVKMGYSDELIEEATGFAETNDVSIIEARGTYKRLLSEHKEQTDKDAVKVKAAGGLCVIGTERHESRRIDNQLRGRSGRQGDPGTSIFYLSLEDDLMRLFGGEKVANAMTSLKIDENQPLDQKILSGALESAQGKVEGRNFQARKHVLEYDNVLNKQREVIYGQRQSVLNGNDIKASILSMLGEYVENGVNAYAGERNYVDILDAPDMLKKFEKLFIDPGEIKFTREYLDSHSKKDIINMLKEKAFAFYEAKEAKIGSEVMRELERVVLLKVVDAKWMEHIDAMHELRRGVGFAAYAQTDPVVVYKQQGLDMFDQMVSDIREETARTVLLAQIVGSDAPKREKLMNPIVALGSDGTTQQKPVKKQKVGRNDPCPCGSGLKYKKCCGK
ncbi:MAG: SEC-C domain-containing protein, partial [Clostridia bacterium]|nr:SEC-C domain-containing protein [Clostridia bacterium]